MKVIITTFIIALLLYGCSTTQYRGISSKSVKKMELSDDENVTFISPDLEISAIDKVGTDNNDIIQLLGTGYDPSLVKVKSKAFNLTPINSGTAKNTSIEAISVTSSEDFSKFINASASVKGNFGALKVRGKKSFKDYVTISSFEVIFIASAIVKNPKHVGINYKADKLFLETLKKFPNRFRELFGTSVISEVTTGAECVLVFKFKSDSESSYRELVAKAKAKAGSFSAKASFSQAITELNKIKSAEWKLLINGVNEIPSPDIDSAVNYLFNFPNLVTKEQYTILETGTTDYLNISVLNKYEIRKIINYGQVDTLEAGLNNANYMYDEIEYWKDDVDYVLNNKSIFHDTTFKNASSDLDFIRIRKSELFNYMKKIIDREEANLLTLENLSFTRRFYSRASIPTPPIQPIIIKPKKESMGRNDNGTHGGKN